MDSASLSSPFLLSSPISSISTSSSHRSISFPIRSRFHHRRRILAVRSSCEPQSTSQTLDLTKASPNFLDLVRNSLSLVVFSVAVGFLPLSAVKIPAVAAPITETRPRNGSVSSDHEFSPYTRKRLASVSVLMARIEEVKSSKGDMKAVRAALKEIKSRKREIKGEVLEKLNSDTREWRKEKLELIRKSGDVLDLALEAKRERDSLLKKSGGSGKSKVQLERLENAIGDAEKEYNGLWERIGELEEKIMRKETMAYSIGIRELSFIERESELLVERFTRQLRFGGLER